MKKHIENVVTLLLGVILGIFVVFQFSTGEDIRNIFENDIGISRIWEWNVNASIYLPIAVYVLVSVIFVLLITYLVRFFTNTRNLKKTASFLNVFIQLFLGVPITVIIYILLDPLLNQLEIDAIFKLGIGALAYAILFEIVCKAFEKAFYDKLQKGHKRCKLIVCTVVGDSAYEETKIIVEKMTFEECYSTMKNSGEQAVVRQFFKIVEMNWNGSKVVDEWRYYQNGDFIQENDEDLCKKLMVAEYATKVQWQG